MVDETTKTYKIAIDAMGGDNAPCEIVAGAVLGLKFLKDGWSICLVGDESSINAELSKHNYDKKSSLIEVVHTTETVLACDSPVDAIKSKKDSSMRVGLNLVKSKEADAFISAGNTGALLTGAVLFVGRIKGVDRPAIATLLPNKETFSLLLDAGANAECKPSYLAQFALMGSMYMQNIQNVANPRVGLVNVGSESSKGDALRKEAHELLVNLHNDKMLNFIGNIEGNDIPSGKADVIVADGFSGNLILKHSEGLSSALFSIIKKEITSSVASKLAAAVLKNDFRRLKKRFDASEYGGAPLLGLNGLVVKAHGGSDRIAVSNAVRQCVSFLSLEMTDKISDAIAKSNSKPEGTNENENS